MIKALGDRLAEAFAEKLHKIARDLCGFGVEEDLSTEQLIKEEYRSIRPAPGYPSCPDHTEKAKIFNLLKVHESIQASLTENYAMSPASSVCGYYFNHHQAKYFNISKINKDQVLEYAERKKISLEETNKWLAPLLL
jgi:5-methyltetrahydrofolate--homocysteine methyltransferase